VLGIILRPFRRKNSVLYFAQVTHPLTKMIGCDRLEMGEMTVQYSSQVDGNARNLLITRHVNGLHSCTYH